MHRTHKKYKKCFQTEMSQTKLVQQTSFRIVLVILSILVVSDTGRLLIWIPVTYVMSLQIFSNRHHNADL